MSRSRLFSACVALAVSVGFAAQSEQSQRDARALAMVQKAEALRIVGRYGGAVDAIREAQAQAEGAQARALTMASEGLLASDLGDARAPDLLRDASALAERSDMAIVAALASARRAAALHESDPVSASAAALRARTLGQGGPGAVLAAIEIDLAVAEAALDPATALARLQTALTQLTPLVEEAGPGRSLIDLGVAAERISAPGVAARAYQLAANAPDGSIAASALVELARLYDANNDRRAGLDAADRAIRIAAAIGRDDVIFRAAWLRGSMLVRSGASEAALDDFRAAFGGLRRIREDLGRSYIGGVSVFRRQFGAFHAEFVDLLTTLAGDTSQDLLSEAREVMEDLKIEEVEDYFQQRCVAERSDLVRSAVLSDKTAVLYPIILPDRLEVLLERDGVIHRETHSIKRRTLVRLIKLARLDMEKFGRAYERNSALVYDLLIRPFEDQLRGAETIVFVPDGALRLLPMAALWDGERFLAEKYGLATVLGLNLIEPEAFPSDQIRTLVVGATEVPNRDATSMLPRLDAVRREMADIHSIMGGEELAEDDFEVEAFRAALNTKPFGVVHVATHALIGARPEDNFIAASNGPIDIQEMALSLRASSLLNGQPLELLTLSACATARGDDRAPLGLAGVAYTAGARSVLASLWPVFDNPTADLMKDFYDGLSKGLGRAGALQKAQLNLLGRGGEFRDPAAWAAFTIIGDWR